MRRASEAARELIEKSAPRLLISFGIAGAVEADLKIGDVVVPEAYCTLEHGVPGPLLALRPWPEIALKAAALTAHNRGACLVSGTAVTTGGVKVLEDQLCDLVHPILEMETAGIAPVAAENGIPFLCMRAISDGPGAPIPFDLGEIMDEDANIRTGRILMEIARHPRIVFQLRGLVRNSWMAADMVAKTLVDALGSQDIIS